MPNVQVYNGLRDSLVAANQSHAKGKHPTEWNQLGAFINQLLGQRGKGIDTATGTGSSGTPRTSSPAAAESAAIADLRRRAAVYSARRLMSWPRLRIIGPDSDC